MIEATYELNSAQHVLHCTAHNSKLTPGTGLCEHVCGTTGSDCENKFEVETLQTRTANCNVHNDQWKIERDY